MLLTCIYIFDKFLKQAYDMFMEYFFGNMVPDMCTMKTK